MNGIVRHNDNRFSEPVNESVDGGEVARRWLALNEDQRGAGAPAQLRVRLAEVPSPMREYQSSQEFLAVLNEEADREVRLATVQQIREMCYVILTDVDLPEHQARPFRCVLDTTVEELAVLIEPLQPLTMNMREVKLAVTPGQ
jgi:hypothetical protein